MRLNNGENVVEYWRFHNRKDVSVGDRVFLLRQVKSKQTPAGFSGASILSAEA